MAALEEGLHSARRCAVPAALLALGIGCAGESGESGSMVVRDSAGITIVENISAAWAEGEGWRLSDEPVLTIGVLEGPEEYQLFQAVAARQLRGGEIVVANSGTHELRFYDSTGVFLRAVGREGEGPGEFRMMGMMWRAGRDSLVVFDFGLTRLTVLSARGEFGRTFTLAQLPSGGPPLPVGPFSDGSFLAYTSAIGPGREMREGYSRDTFLYGRFAASGEIIDTLVRLPGHERQIATVGGRSRFVALPYGRSPVVAAAADRWYYGASDAWETERYSPAGTLTGITRRAVTNRPITADIAEDYRRSVLEGSSRAPDPFRQWRANMPLPETMPAYRQFLVDDEGNLWVAEYKRRGEQPSWAVFDPEGQFLGNVDTPADGRVSHIGSDFVLGIWDDEMDVQQVRMYRLVKEE